MNSNDFAQFIDELRASRNLSREEFVDGIISLRHYYRFIKGESTVSSDVILDFLNKLEISDSLLYEFYQSQTNKNYSTLIDVYKYVYVDNLKDANSLFKEINRNSLRTESNKKLYDFVKLLLNVKQKFITYDQASETIIELINYPEVLKKDVLSFVEKSALVYLVNYLMTREDNRIAEFFYKIVQKEIKDNVRLDHNTIPFRIITAKCMGMVGDHDKTLSLLKSIENTFVVSDNYLPMVNLYFYKAIAEKNIFNDERYKKSYQKMFALLNIAEGTNIRDTYDEILLRKYGLRESDLIEFK